MTDAAVQVVMMKRKSIFQLSLKIGDIQSVMLGEDKDRNVRDFGLCSFLYMSVEVLYVNS